MPKINFKVGDEVQLIPRKKLKKVYKRFDDLWSFYFHYGRELGEERDLFGHKMVIESIGGKKVPKKYWEFCIETSCETFDLDVEFDPRELELCKKTISLNGIYNGT